MKRQARQLDPGTQAGGLSQRRGIVAKFLPVGPVPTLLRANCVYPAARLSPILQKRAAPSGPIDQSIATRGHEARPDGCLAHVQVICNLRNVRWRHAHHAFGACATVSGSTAAKAKRIVEAGACHLRACAPSFDGWATVHSRWIHSWAVYHRFSS